MKRKLLNVTGVLAIFLFILSLAVLVTIFFTPLYSFDIDFLSISKQTGFSKDILLENYRILLNYLTKPWVTELNLPNFASSKSGLFHFYEVKRLFMLDYLIFGVSGLISFFYMAFLKKTKRKWVLIQPFKLGLFMPLAVLFLMAAGFDRFFIRFHELFFGNDDWLFNPAVDPVILALPEDFFLHTFIFAFVLIELFIFIVYYYAKKTAFKK